MQFSDKDEHVYFWFPLLAGLSELTFDPRPDIRRTALEVGSQSFFSLQRKATVIDMHIQHAGEDECKFLVVIARSLMQRQDREGRNVTIYVSEAELFFIMQVLFDTLQYHGAAFTTNFWMRIFDSVLLPIFDHVRAEVTDTTTFTDEKKRAEVDAWLYETCTQCLQHMVDLVVQFYQLVQPLLSRILDLLSNFIRYRRLDL